MALTVPSSESLRARCDAQRVSYARLSRLSGLSDRTISDALGGSPARMPTLLAIDRALEDDARQLALALKSAGVEVAA